MLSSRCRGFVSQRSATGWVGSRVKNPDPVPSLLLAVPRGEVITTVESSERGAVDFRNSVDDARLDAVRGGDVATAAAAAARRRGTPAGTQAAARAGTHPRTAAKMVRVFALSACAGCEVGRSHRPAV